MWGEKHRDTDATPAPLPSLPGLKLVNAVTVFTVWPPEWRSLRENCFITHTREIEKLQIMFRRNERQHFPHSPSNLYI